MKPDSPPLAKRIIVLLVVGVAVLALAFASLVGLSIAVVVLRNTGSSRALAERIEAIREAGEPPKGARQQVAVGPRRPSASLCRP